MMSAMDRRFLALIVLAFLPGCATRFAPARAFPETDVFRPPLADYRQPRTFLSWQRLKLDAGTFDVAAVGFGQNFGFVRWPLADGGDDEGLQVGISGAVFSQFNLDSPSLDLVNTSYIVGFPVSFRAGPWSARFRLYHESTHLGDEFLLNPQPVPPVPDANLSIEVMETFLARELSWGLRLYGGWTQILASDNPLGRKIFQTGADWRSAEPLVAGARAVAGLDLRTWEETGWDVDVGFKVGLSFTSPFAAQHSLDLLFEFYDGHLPYGQFYRLDGHFAGLVVQFTF